MFALPSRQERPRVPDHLSRNPGRTNGQRILLRSYNSGAASFPVKIICRLVCLSSLSAAPVSRVSERFCPASRPLHDGHRHRRRHRRLRLCVCRGEPRLRPRYARHFLRGERWRERETDRPAAPAAATAAHRGKENLGKCLQLRTQSAPVRTNNEGAPRAVDRPSAEEVTGRGRHRRPRVRRSSS